MAGTAKAWERPTRIDVQPQRWQPGFVDVLKLLNGFLFRSLAGNRGVGLHARIASGNIRLSLIDAALADVAVGACRSGGYRGAVHLRTHDAGETRQQYCKDTRAPTCHDGPKKLDR